MIRALARGNATVGLVAIIALLLFVIVVIVGVVISSVHRDDATLECVRSGHTPADCKGALRP